MTNVPAMAELMSVMAAQPRLAVRESITELVHSMRELPDAMPPESCPVRHMFAPGMYIREITMPAGMVVVGKIHRHAHANFIQKGRVHVLTEHGENVFEAPCSFVSEPGTQRVVHVLEECVWATVHLSTSTDLAELEREIIAESHSDIELQGDYSEVIE